MVRGSLPMFLLLSLEYKCQIITIEHCGFRKFKSFLSTMNSDTRKFTTIINDVKPQGSWGAVSDK